MKGVLLVNLGSPDSTDTKDVKRYLGEFLMDERVIDVPKFLRTILVKGIILNTRPKKSAAAYRKIWWKEGSPLVIISQRFQKKIQNLLDIPVALSMRYGSMSILKGYETLYKKGVTDIFLIPLYPHYAMSSFETVVVKAYEVQKKFHRIHMETLPPFYKNPEYINILSGKIKQYLDNFSYDYLLFSYHGIPERHIRKSDTTRGHCKLDDNCCNTPSKTHKTCYRHQCLETTKAVVEKLSLKKGTYGTSFQSRLGSDPWLKPYTDEKFKTLPKEGKKKLAVVTPAFVADCLETLEEIAMEGKEDFKRSGGEEFLHIPCLNDDDGWVKVMSGWIKKWETNYNP